MPCVTNDFLVGHAIAVGGCDKPGPQTMRAHRFGQSAIQPGLGNAFEKDLSNRISGAAKRELDPKSMMNPGVLIDP